MLKNKFFKLNTQIHKNLDVDKKKRQTFDRRKNLLRNFYCR